MLIQMLRETQATVRNYGFPQRLFRHLIENHFIFARLAAPA
ncbi:hypothetical protein [Burkholderia sp. WAC0059]|nr:hypothetical protein [Burkholderia sp. WAC0059]